MQYRTLGKTGYEVSVIGFGAWAIGGSWGRVDDRESIAALHTAIDNGVNFIDTADVYGDGRSERLVAQVARERSERIYIATKTGRRLDPHTADAYTPQAIEGFIDDSLKNMGLETLDLVQLHCPPTDVYYRPDLFESLEEIKRKGKIRHWGVSVERVEEAIKAIEYPGCASVQIIYNIFRQRPAEVFFPLARERNVGILARLPLSSGMLTGKLRRDSRFEPDDHRSFNHHGEAFDRGETFSGIDYEKQLEAVEALRPLVPGGMTMAQFALRWILMNEQVTCAIPGARNPEQALQNAQAGGLDALGQETMQAVRRLYEERIRPMVHYYW